MIAVIVRTVFISALNKFFHLFLAETVTLHSSRKAEVLIGMNKHAEYIRVVFQNVVCTSSDNDAGFLFGKFLYCLSLIIKKVVIGSKALIFRRKKFTCIRMA